MTGSTVSLTMALMRFIFRAACHARLNERREIMIHSKCENSSALFINFVKQEAVITAPFVS